MQLTWLTNRRRFVGTQTEAKSLKEPFEVIDVPTDKQGLMEYLNRIEEGRENAASPAPADPAPETPTIATSPEQMRPSQLERFEAVARRLGWTPPGEAPPPTPAAAPTVSLDSVEALIDEIAGNDLIRILSASISRLGEVAGIKGWAAFAKNTYAWSAGAKSTEQGLGMLMLAAFDNFGLKTERSDQSTT